MRSRHLILAACATLWLGAGTAVADGGPIMPLSQIHAGMDCIGETVIQGTTITSFDVHVIDVVQDPVQGPRILVSVSGPAVDTTGIAQGFSGSPVLCLDGTGTMRNAGAISEGIGEYGNKVALVTPIEQMLGEPIKPPSGAPRLRVRTYPLLGPLTIGGLSPSLLGVVQRAGLEAGRTVLPAPSGSMVAFGVQPLVPGASFAVGYSSGAVAVGAVGTVTYRDGQTMYGFGHPLDGAGRRSLILQDAYVYYVVNNPNADPITSFKLAVPGHVLGTLTSDTPNGVIGTVGTPPGTVPLDVTARDGDTGALLALHSDVADETDIGMPLGTSLIGLVAPLQVAQAATEIYNGAPANESGHMCLSATIRELRTPLRFCNRYVTSGIPGGAGGLVPPGLALVTSIDATTALSLIDQEQFAQLHVRHVSVTLDAERGLREASIVSAHAAKRVRAGSQVTVRLLVQVVRGRLRTVTLRLRIPAGARGRLVAKIVNPTSQGPGGSAEALAQALAAALGGNIGSGSFQPPPTSLAGLRKAFAGVSIYDGLELHVGGHETQRIYRDPALLITGQAKLVFQVKR